MAAESHGLTSRDQGLLAWAHGRLSRAFAALERTSRHAAPRTPVRAPLQILADRFFGPRIRTLLRTLCAPYTTSIAVRGAPNTAVTKPSL